MIIRTVKIFKEWKNSAETWIIFNNNNNNNNNNKWKKINKLPTEYTRNLLLLIIRILL